jgi:hypothetical protein
MAELWPPDHLNHFPAPTLRRALEDEDFEIVSDLHVNNPFPFSVPSRLVRLLWLLSTSVAPVLRLMGSGLHYEVLARRR